MRRAGAGEDLLLESADRDLGSAADEDAAASWLVQQKQHGRDAVQSACQNIPSVEQMTASHWGMQEKELC